MTRVSPQNVHTGSPRTDYRRLIQWYSPYTDANSIARFGSLRRETESKKFDVLKAMLLDVNLVDKTDIIAVTLLLTDWKNFHEFALFANPYYANITESRFSDSFLWVHDPTQMPVHLMFLEFSCWCHGLNTYLILIAAQWHSWRNPGGNHFFHW